MPGPPPPPPHVTQGRTATTPATTTTSAPSYQSKSSSSIKKSSGGTSRISSNISQLGNVKFMIIISFWLIFLFEGAFSAYYCDLLSMSLRLWSNEDYGSPAGCYDSELFDSQDTAYTSRYQGFTLTELSEQCSSEGVGWIWVGVLGVFTTFYIFSTLLLNIGSTSKMRGNKFQYKTYFICNYILAHILSMPLFTLIVGISQGLIISGSYTSYVIGFVFKHGENDNNLYYWQLYFNVYDCQGLWEDMENITSKLVIVINIAYFAFIVFAFFIPFIVMIMYMVRGKNVFYENKKYHCLIYFRWINDKLYGNQRLQQVCNYCELICCINRSNQLGRMDTQLDRYNSASAQL